MKNNLFKMPDIPDDKLLINEYFISIQGEGFHTGKAAFFIRFSGCDIGCQWCDTKDAVSVKNSKLISINKLISEVRKSGLPMVVITGGEPALHKLDIICSELKKSGLFIQLETSGAYPVKTEFDWLTLSPKKINHPDKKNYPPANELKVVIRDISDLDFAVEQKSKVNKDCHLYLQPEWSVRKEIIPTVLNFIFHNPEWKLSLQVHKYVGIK